MKISVPKDQIRLALALAGLFSFVIAVTASFLASPVQLEIWMTASRGGIARRGWNPASLLAGKELDA